VITVDEKKKKVDEKKKKVDDIKKKNDIIKIQKCWQNFKNTQNNNAAKTNVHPLDNSVGVLYKIKQNIDAFELRHNNRKRTLQNILDSFDSDSERPKKFWIHQYNQNAKDLIDILNPTNNTIIDTKSIIETISQLDNMANYLTENKTSNRALLSSITPM
jgi:hypothetical protein